MLAKRYHPAGTTNQGRALLPSYPLVTAIDHDARHPPRQSSFHEEIIKFMDYMKPTSRELAIRQSLVKRFTELIRSFRMAITVQPVGSYITGLNLSTSDINIVLTFSATSRLSYLIRSDLRTILAEIRTSGFARNLIDVLQASVPLIRSTDKVAGIDIDLTAADTHGVLATDTVQKGLPTDLKPIKTLVTVVKMFLAIRRCGTTYTGGVNSCMLVWMVVAWVRLERPKMRRKFVRRNEHDDDDDDDELATLTAMIELNYSRKVSMSLKMSGSMKLLDMSHIKLPIYYLIILDDKIDKLLPVFYETQVGR